MLHFTELTKTFTEAIQGLRHAVIYGTPALLRQK
jgi:hypothetical protein